MTVDEYANEFISIVNHKINWLMMETVGIKVTTLKPTSRQETIVGKWCTVISIRINENDCLKRTDRASPEYRLD